MFQDEISVEAINQFTKDFTDGKIPQFYKSQEIPQENDRIIKTIVGKTFEDLVMNPSADVFVQYFEGRSNSTKQFAPTWVKLAREFPGVTFGVFDVSKNEAEHALPK